jgi:hypothetical protein
MQEFIDDPMAVMVMLVIVGLILSEIEQRQAGISHFWSGKKPK